MWYGSLSSLPTLVHNYIGRYYWDGKLHLLPQTQHVYDSEDRRPEFISFQVARLGQVYDHSGFWDYPSRMGWRVEREDRRCHEGRCLPGVCTEGDPSPYGLQTPSISRAEAAATIPDKVAFLQSWLFFGALAEAYALSGLTVDHHEFSADVYDTTRLNGLPLRLFLAAQRSRRAGSRELRERLHSIIRQVQLMITRSSDWEDEHEYDLDQCKALFSIHILLRTLSLALLCHSRLAYLGPYDPLKPSVADAATDWKPEGQMSMMALTYHRLAGRGWCKGEMWHILQSFDVAAFACDLERPHAIQNHDSCTDTTCLAYQVNEGDYRTIHVNAECDCPSLDVNPTELRDILMRNKIPVILISDNLRLDVAEADETVYYVAISHVWADGLGNPVHNALPTCQIRRLQHLITALSDAFGLRNRRKSQLALWIDTLCIPVAPEFKEQRKLAIRMLARIYTEAAGVLVLDRELSRFESRKASILELSVRVACSGWLKRLWTLQEASLAGTQGGNDGSGTLYIQMADGSVHWNRLSKSFHYKPSRQPPRRTRPSPLSVSMQEVKTELVYGMHLLVTMEDRLPSVREISNPRFETQLQKIMGAVQNRSTSKRDDEPICIASLLGLDLAEILRVDGADERMAKFYTLLRDIPSAIVFAEFGVPGFLTRNLAKKPFRWAPRSLLLLDRPMEINLAVSAMQFADPPLPLLGVCEEDGLHIQHPGFVFDDADLVLQRDSVLVERESGERYHLSLALSDTSPQCIGPMEHCALVFKTDIASDVVVVRVESDLGHSEDAEYYVTIVGHGTVKAWRDEDPTVHATISRSSLDLSGLAKSRDQKWCFT